MNLLEKIQWNLNYHLLRWRMWLLGKEIRCDVCGKPAGKVILHLQDGVIHLEGLEHSGVFVDFKSINALRFRHSDQSECSKHGEPNAPR